MTAFLKIDDCKTCHRALPWEWVPTVLLTGKPLAGTGVWHSQLSNGLCPACITALEFERQQAESAKTLRIDLTKLLGGEKPYREFTFERYKVTPGNRRAFQRSKHFNPATDNLYLWGSCGVGKTHLAYATARSCFEETLSVNILRPWQLSRKVRMKEPEEEQAGIDEIVNVEVLVLDDIGVGSETAYSRQILQEILDGREFMDRAGLLITSKYSLGDLAQKMNDDTIPSRVSGMCQVLEIKGPDRRLMIPHGDYPVPSFTNAT
jgi:DNA replication protein DnaC